MRELFLKLHLDKKPVTIKKRGEKIDKKIIINNIDESIGNIRRKKVRHTTKEMLRNNNYSIE